MTDNEIVKALECCAEPVGINCCKCPLEKDCLEVNMCELALDLINRQKAEIERLQKELKITRAYIHDNGLEWGLVSHLEFYKNQRAEAYKAFAEIVKKIDFYQYIEEYYENAELCYEFRQDWFNEKIDNLLKELVG